MNHITKIGIPTKNIKLKHLYQLFDKYDQRDEIILDINKEYVSLKDKLYNNIEYNETLDQNDIRGQLLGRKVIRQFLKRLKKSSNISFYKKYIDIIKSEVIKNTELMNILNKEIIFGIFLCDAQKIEIFYITYKINDYIIILRWYDRPDQNYPDSLSIEIMTDNDNENANEISDITMTNIFLKIP